MYIHDLDSIYNAVTTRLCLGMAHFIQHTRHHFHLFLKTSKLILVPHSKLVEFPNVLPLLSIGVHWLITPVLSPRTFFTPYLARTWHQSSAWKRPPLYLPDNQSPHLLSARQAQTPRTRKIARTDTSTAPNIANQDNCCHQLASQLRKAGHLGNYHAWSTRRYGVVRSLRGVCESREGREVSYQWKGIDGADCLDVADIALG